MDSHDKTETFVVFDNLHIVLWLIKDMCWAMEWKAPGIAMIFPTLALASFICIKTKTKSFSFLPNLAILFWILANSIWMIDEFFLLEIRLYCLVFFGLGLALVFFWLFSRFDEIKFRLKNQSFK
jgi:hypothetical protein